MGEAEIPARAPTGQFMVGQLGLLPSNWRICEIGSVCSLIVDCPHTTPKFRDEGVLVARTANIRDGRFVLQGESYVDEHEYRARILRAEPQAGDVIFTREAPVGEAFVVPPGMRVCLGQRVMLLRPDSSVLDSTYLLSQICSDFVRSRIATLTAGTTNPHLNVGDVRGFLLPVPPVAEQRRIAEILDAADEAIRSRERLITKLNLIKQGLLSGLLTHATAKVAKPTPLGDVSVIAGGVTLGREISGSGSIELPYLRVANVQDGYIDTSDMKVIRVLRAEVGRYLLRSGDVLMTEGGDFDKLGRGAVWDGSIDPCLHQNHIFRVRCDPSALLPEFLAMYSASSAGRRNFVLMSKQTTNLASINMTQLKTFPVPIPSLSEQSRIVAAANAQGSDLRCESETLHKLRLVKQGLMDDLLTGRVRVKALA
jgi:type I restriction enzyme S subunit